METRRLKVMVALLFAPLMASTGLAAAQSVPHRLVGTLNIVWGDPHPAHRTGGETIYMLEGLDPATVPPQLSAQARVRLRLRGKENLALHYFGKRVIVSGSVVPNSTGTPQPAQMDVASIGPAQAPQASAQAGMFGTRKVIFLLLQFSDDTAVPHPPAFYTDMTNPDTPPSGEVFPTTINGFFKKTSWNQFSWVGDVGGAGGVGASDGWLMLPHPKSYYANCGWESMCANLWAIAEDGTALGRTEGINFTNYDNINFVLSNDLDCCAWGGGYSSSTDNKYYGATWEPPWGQETGTYVHEMGHSIGLPHSGWVYYAYDSPWDLMSGRTSASSVTCGSYASKNNGGTDWGVGCTEPGDGYIAPHKEYLGWIPSANVVTTDTNSTVTVTLEADSLALGSAIKMIKICVAGAPCTGSTAHYVTVEARVTGLGTSSQFDNGLPGEGIIIHDFQGGRALISGPCFWNSQSGWAVPIDSTPGDYDSVYCGGTGLYNAQWSPGQTYTNSTYGLAVTVVSRNGSTFVVSVGAAPKKRPGQVTSD